MKATPAENQPPHQNLRMGEDRHVYLHSHLRYGWWSVLVFLTLGLVLEALHGFKVGWYLNVSTETRRLLFTLAHAHGTLLGLVHIAFGFTVAQLPGWSGLGRTVASASLKGATLLLPGGFFLGGLVLHHGDPGLGIMLVPLGALLLLVSVLLCATALQPANVGPPPATGKK
jgi:hypothetical protein